MKVDDRPLPEAWEASAPAISGAIACTADDPSGSPEWSRSYEHGANPEEGKKLWTAHLTAKGWKDTGTTDDDTYRQASFEQDGHTIDLKCSRMVEDKGWCTLVFTAKPS